MEILGVVKSAYNKFETLKGRSSAVGSRKVFNCKKKRENIKGFYKEENGKRRYHADDGTAHELGRCGYTKDNKRVFCCSKCWEKLWKEESEEESEDDE